jgi:CNT family concentrative nucleoside transporter
VFVNPFCNRFFFVLKTTIGQTIFSFIADLVINLYQAADKGIAFVFGPLSIVKVPSDFIFAVKVLPIIIFFGAIMSLLFYWGLIQKIVVAIGFLLKPILGTSGAETLCAVANSFLGQTEAPLLVKDYINGMTKSEFLVVMISGMGSISGAILAVFAGMGVPAKHLLAASVMSVPASILIAKIIFPETQLPQTAGGAKVDFKSASSNAIDAVSSGAIDGLYLALNVGAMLIAFIALIHVINNILGFASTQINDLFLCCNINLNLPNLTLDIILGWICLPFGWLLGFSGNEAFAASQLIGTKVAVNELVAYSKMVTMDLSARTVSIITYALCGFSNFSCIGIQIGGIGALAPEKRVWLSEFGLRAVLGGALANLLSAMVASLLI